MCEAEIAGTQLANEMGALRVGGIRRLRRGDPRVRFWVLGEEVTEGLSRKGAWGKEGHSFFISRGGR